MQIKQQLIRGIQEERIDFKDFIINDISPRQLALTEEAILASCEIIIYTAEQIRNQFPRETNG